MTCVPRPGDEADDNDALLLRYDAWGRLAEVWDDENASGGIDAGNDTHLASYRYDGLHRRIRSTHETTDTDRDFYYNTSWHPSRGPAARAIACSMGLRPTGP